MSAVTMEVLEAAESAYRAAAREMDPRPMRAALEAALKLVPLLPQAAACDNCGSKIVDYSACKTDGRGKYFCGDYCFITYKGD